MQESFSVVINGPGCTRKKSEISKTAKEQNKSRSEFMLWLYEQFVRSIQRTKAAK